ncbi:hypothetical protein LPB85_16025 [Chryseobacterium sp. LC2016-27]|uniref:hypothetical protein n=1 Tax=Chryseobacterium sp. LC2016-27 TaxID=2897326 RepID=UPI001E653BF1|nr:hypothetical protein [Chryseobacterium sp. LC2016-27]MCD0456957.1 hypothetical protein [Chryseobacterium sp. LC2016-27]
MKNLFIKNFTIFAILRIGLLILSMINVCNYYFKKIQLFNENITDYSTRFLIGKFIILLMAISCILELISLLNLFSFYQKKYLTLNYVLGGISILIALPLLYNFQDDYNYFSGKVNPFSFIIPCLYLICGIFDFSIAGKKIE